MAIVSWQAPYTLGRRLAEKQPVVKIFGEDYPLRADVEVIGGMSAHAGQELLEKYARSVQGRAHRIVLVHGEMEAATALREKLDGPKATEILYPDLFETLAF